MSPPHALEPALALQMRLLCTSGAAASEQLVREVWVRDEAQRRAVLAVLLDLAWEFLDDAPMEIEDYVAGEGGGIRHRDPIIAQASTCAELLLRRRDGWHGQPGAECLPDEAGRREAQLDAVGGIVQRVLYLLASAAEHVVGPRAAFQRAEDLDKSLRDLLSEALAAAAQKG